MDISVKKPGIVSGYILGDLRPQISAEVLIDGNIITINTALIDSGSNVTVLSPLVCEPSQDSESAEVQSAHKRTSARVATGSLILGNNDIVLDNISFLIADLEIFECSEIQLVIGMDIITAGRFVIERKGRLPYFSFSFPGSERPFIPSVGAIY